MTTTGHLPSHTAADAGRLPGPDVVRAVALIGVVLLNFHGYLVIRGSEQSDTAVGRFFDPWSGPLATRFAATFVLVAGVGVTLFTRRARHDPAALAAKQWTLVRRGLTLYGGGLLLDMVWPGTILPFYGAMFVLGAVLCGLRSGWVALVGAVAALAGAGIAWWSLERRLDGHDTSWLSRPGADSPRGLVLDTFVNGTHPLFPWLAFFCAGILVGRFLAATAWRPAVLAAGFLLFGVATIAGSTAGTGERAALLSVDPYSRALPYTMSALGTALLAFGALSWVADRFPTTAPIRALRDAGAMSLTLYVAHALVFLLVVDRLEWVRPTGLDTALLLAAGYWVAAIAAGAAWHRRFGIGPVEWLYRRLGG